MPGMSARRPPRPPSPAAGDRWAWFLDIDGTLLEIAAEPHLVTADASLLALLAALREACGGAVALVSGRSLAQIDGIFGAFEIAAAGSHGLEQRLPDGSLRRLAGEVPAACVEHIEAFAHRREGLLVEHKPHSMSLHYRQRPELEAEVLRAMEEAHAWAGDAYRLLPGKMVVEFVPRAADKGAAIRSFMQEPPFAGRRPVFVGDDVTDEHGFAVVNEMGGMSVRIGDAAASGARWQLADVGELHDWLRSTLTPT